LQEKARETDPLRRRQLREEWVGAVNRLYEQLLGWLKDADPDRLLQIVDFPIDKLEAGLGNYQVRQLTITLGDATILIIPAGRMVVGPLALREQYGKPAEGRIDITNNASKVLLFRYV